MIVMQCMCFRLTDRTDISLTLHYNDMCSMADLMKLVAALGAPAPQSAPLAGVCRDS